MMALSTPPQGFVLSELLQGFGDAGEHAARRIVGLSLDSRTIAKGDAFCALQGGRRHGLDFAPLAAQRGAEVILAESAADWPLSRMADLAAQIGAPIVPLNDLSQRISALAARFYADPSACLDITAVTGTNGKTSVCHYLAQALQRQQACAVIGTLGYGLPDALQDTRHTTPDAIQLQDILARLKTLGSASVAMEMSSHALDQGRAAAVHVDTAVFTNLTRDHLDYHLDMAAYAAAKRRLFQLPGLKNAVLNVDDEYGRALLKTIDPGIRRVAVSLDAAWRAEAAGGDWIRADALEVLPRGMHIRFSSSWGDGQFDSALLGRFNVANLLTVLALLLLKDWPLDSALEQLALAQGVPGRMECFGVPGQPLVVVDYAHTPDALEQALNVLREHRPRRLFCVFGCGGERDRGKRAQMGVVAERLSDELILTDDNPRGEDGERIVADILSAMRRPEQVLTQRKRGRAIRHAVCLAGPGDIVLIAGKGHETVQYIGDLALPFSDRAQVTQVLNEWGDCR